jgi:hypothetical protein
MTAGDVGVRALIRDLESAFDNTTEVLYDRQQEYLLQTCVHKCARGGSACDLLVHNIFHEKQHSGQVWSIRDRLRLLQEWVSADLFSCWTHSTFVPSWQSGESAGNVAMPLGAFNWPGRDDSGTTRARRSAARNRLDKGDNDGTERWSDGRRSDNSGARCQGRGCATADAGESKHAGHLMSAIAPMRAPAASLARSTSATATCSSRRTTRFRKTGATHGCTIAHARLSPTVWSGPWEQSRRRPSKTWASQMSTIWKGALQPGRPLGSQSSSLATARNFISSPTSTSWSRSICTRHSHRKGVGWSATLCRPTASRTTTGASTITGKSRLV